MPSYLTAKLEFSPDPLSVTSPTWTDVSAWLISAAWSTGKQRDLDDPQNGQATFALRNDQRAGSYRQFQPEDTGSRFYPNVVPRRRFRFTITADGTSYPQGIWYATSYQPGYLAQTAVQTVTVTCVDGFGLLALDLLGPLDPPSAATYPDVIAFDSPFAYYRLGDQRGTKMTAQTGPDGVYSFGFLGIQPYVGPPLVVGDSTTCLTFPGAFVGKAPVGSQVVFSDANAFTIEAVLDVDLGRGSTSLGCGPVGGSAHICRLWYDGIQLNAEVQSSASATTSATGATAVTTGIHHAAATWDGQTLSIYLDGALDGSVTLPGVKMKAADANGFLWVGNDQSLNLNFGGLQEVAFYETALSASRIAAHYAAARTLGYAQQLTGARAAAALTNPLWSTAGITTTAGLTLAPQMQAGQSKLDEVTAISQAERPLAGTFYFDGSGNPQYTAYDPTALVTPAATFGETRYGDISYDDLQLAYDDELYNKATITRDGGSAQTASDSTSQAAYGTRGYDDSGRILALDTDAQLVAQTIIDRFAQPMFRCDSITLNASQQNTRTQILTRDPGDTIRVRRRGEDGTVDFDIITPILGGSYSLDTSRHLTCTWSLGRGFNAQAQVWRLGVNGFDELGSTAILG